MRLPETFQFSQASLQAFVDCPRRFQLRYVERITWPDVAAEHAMDHERRLLAGQAFHRLAAQHVAGIDAQALAISIAPGGELERWWRNYLAAPPPGLGAIRQAETTFTAPLAGYRLLAMYDLLAITPGERASIVDWKTYRSRPTRPTLAARLQTRVYPYVLARAGHEINDGEPISAEQIEMVYWFADFPMEPARFAYNAAQMRADEVYLASLIEEITALADAAWPLTTDGARCTFCRYAPLCGRAGGPGEASHPFSEAEEPGEADLDLQLDLEQIAEIEY